MKLRAVGLTLFLVSAACVDARADFIVTVGSTTIPQGGLGTLDVLIRSTNPAGDALASFGFEFLITPTGPRRLEFLNPQSDTELTSPAYVFSGNSANLADSLAIGNVSSTGGGTNNRYVGGDDTVTGSVLVGAGDRLLVRLDLNAATAIRPAVGETFLISLVTGPFTAFRNVAGATIAYTAQPGTVTIGAPVVPEPSSLALTAAGVTLLLALRKRPSLGGLRPKIDKLYANFHADH